jgi:hypothetical protein
LPAWWGFNARNGKESNVNRIREFLKGKKAYLTAAIGVLGAVVAWADGQIDGVALLAAFWAAAQACFIRAGIANEVRRVQ